MKNLLPLLSLLCLLSCGKDELLSDSIVGQWRLESVSIDDCPDPENNVTAETADLAGCTTLNTTMLCQTIVFNANGTAVNTSITDGVTNSQDLTYTVDEDNNNITSCDENNNCTTFAINNNRISLSNPFGDCTINPTYVKS